MKTVTDRETADRLWKFMRWSDLYAALANAREEGRQEERARWLAWATDLGYGEQELP